MPPITPPDETPAPETPAPETPAEIEIGRQGACGLARLSRPRALNALSLEMVAGLDGALRGWARDATIGCAWIEGAGEKAFCAGGDVRAVWQAAREGTESARRRAAAFFRAEYLMNREIFRFPKPCVAWMDGITMGGGVGLSAHGSHRVATERTVWAMPETAIGLFPDVGAAWHLARLPGETGLYLALTGETLEAADLYALGLATHVIPAARREAVRAELTALDAPPAVAREAAGAILDRWHEDPGPPPLAESRAEIDRLFAGDSLAEIQADLAAAESDFARRTRAHLAGRSPLSLALATRHLREAFFEDFDAVIARDYRLAQLCLESADFLEGVRSVLVDKDHTPRWADSLPADRIEVAFARDGGRDGARDGAGFDALPLAERDAEEGR